MNYRKDNYTVRDGYLLFWRSYLSNWYPSKFTVDGVEYNCGEQWMMAAKAMLFKDSGTLAKILETTVPRQQKALGREVKGYDEKVWDEQREDLVYKGLLEKFRQNPELRDKLLETRGLHLVEASPVDVIWGIGLAEDDADATNPEKWKGRNLLGKVLMRVRDTLSLGITDE